MSRETLEHGLLHDGEDVEPRLPGRGAARTKALGAFLVLGMVVVLASYSSSTRTTSLDVPIASLSSDSGPAMVRIPQITQDELLRKAPYADGSKTYVRDIVESTVPGKEMTGGLYLMNKGHVLVRKYTYAEFKYVIWGEFHLTDGTGKKVVAKEGDLMYFPTGSTITFQSSHKALAYFVGQRTSPYTPEHADAYAQAAIAANPAMQHFPHIASTHLPKLAGSGDSKSFLGDIAVSKVPGREMAAGLYHLEAGPALHYTYTYEEFKYIVAGEFHLTDGTGQKRVARAGDLMYFPRGTKVTFSTPSSALGFFVGQRKGDTV